MMARETMYAVEGQFLTNGVVKDFDLCHKYLAFHYDYTTGDWGLPHMGGQFANWHGGTRSI